MSRPTDALEADGWDDAVRSVGIERNPWITPNTRAAWERGWLIGDRDRASYQAIEARRKARLRALYTRQVEPQPKPRKARHEHGSDW